MKGEMLVLDVYKVKKQFKVEGELQLEILQQLLGGYLEVVPGFDSIVDDGGTKHRCVAMVDEEGKLKQLPVNVQGTAMWDAALHRVGRERPCPMRGRRAPDVLCGPVIIITGDDEFMRSL